MSTRYMIHYMECEECRTRQTLPFHECWEPLPLEVNAFRETHRDCEKRGPMYGRINSEIPAEWLAVKQKVLDQWQHEPWFRGVGIGEWGVVVLLLDEVSIQHIPSEMDGIPLTTHVTGDIRLHND